MNAHLASSSVNRGVPATSRSASFEVRTHVCHLIPIGKPQASCTASAVLKPRPLRLCGHALSVSNGRLYAESDVPLGIDYRARRRTGDEITVQLNLDANTVRQPTNLKTKVTSTLPMTKSYCLRVISRSHSATVWHIFMCKVKLEKLTTSLTGHSMQTMPLRSLR